MIAPLFGTRTMRITDAVTLGKKGLFLEYSKCQAFSADQSFFLLRDNDGNVCLFETKT
ncbi:MAG: hypothetical protein HQM10_24265 [Candidatus Riflebacteria bacterium]|nr:hypothetical protein [Candidatus Riflebacteria bacterium]